MKKYFLSLGLMVAAAFTLTNCTEQIDAPVEPTKVPFEIIASTVNTRTTAGDDLSTLWSEGDALNVFHVFSGDDTYISDGKFELTADDVFSGEITGTFSEGDCYNWYALYPYNKNVSTPANTGNKGYVTVGSGSSSAQVQTGNSSMAHIAGQNYPLAGVAEDVEYETGASLDLTMTHLSSLLEVVVKNETGKDLVVESVSFTGTEDLVGTYYIDFTGTEPIFTASGNNYVAKTAKLEVVEGQAIPSGQSAKFYLAIKPFTATGELSLAVNNIAKPKTVNEVKFAPGAVKTLNYTMLATDFLETSDIADAIEAEDSEIVQIEGLVIARYASGYLVQDETGIMLVYTSSTPEQVVGDKVNVTGTKGTYNAMSQLKTPTIKVLSQNNTVSHPTPTVLDGTAMDAQLTATEVSYIQFEGKLSVSNNKYYNVTVEGASTAQGSISYPESSLGLNGMNGKNIKVSGYYIGASSSKYVNVMAVAVEEIPTVENPVISCSDNTVTITSEEGSTVYYTTDGSDPVSSNTKQTYSAPFTITETCTVKAYATLNGKLPSDVVSKECVVITGSEVVVLYESFDNTDGTGGNDGQWNGTIASSSIVYDVDGWETVKSGGAKQCIKLGTGSVKGSATTPALGVAGDMTLTFKSAAWSGDAEILNLSVEGGGSLSMASVTLKSAEWSSYTVVITGATAETKVKFEANIATKNRFFLDEVRIVK